MMVFLMIVATIAFLSAITKTGTLNQNTAKWCFIASVLAMTAIHVANLMK